MKKIKTFQFDADEEKTMLGIRLALPAEINWVLKSQPSLQLQLI